MWVDMMAIPIDAPHPDEAPAFINIMQRPEVAAANTDFSRLATGNAKSHPMIADAVRHNRSIYPSAEDMTGLFTDGAYSEEYDRLLNRSLTRFVAGK
jgi:putrescine transport system substrate-binding protein